jgi:hypothetical protein
LQELASRTFVDVISQGNRTSRRELVPQRTVEAVEPPGHFDFGRGKISEIHMTLLEALKADHDKARDLLAVILDATTPMPAARCSASSRPTSRRIAGRRRTSSTRG